MTDPTRKNLVAILGIIGLGLIVGLANNLLAGDARRLAWVGSYPPKGEPGCKKYEAELAAKALAATSPAAANPAAANPVAATAIPEAAPEIPPIPSGSFWVELAPAQVKVLFDRGALFIDARRSAAFEEGHVQGAMSIPIWESGVEEKIAQVVFHEHVQGDVTAPIVVYCNGGDCEDSHMVSDKLGQAGHTAVYVYKDGWPDWTTNAWPMATGAAQ